MRKEWGRPKIKTVWTFEARSEILSCVEEGTRQMSVKLRSILSCHQVVGRNNVVALSQADDPNPERLYLR